MASMAQLDNWSFCGLKCLAARSSVWKCRRQMGHCGPKTHLRTPLTTPCDLNLRLAQACAVLRTRPHSGQGKSLSGAGLRVCLPTCAARASLGTLFTTAFHAGDLMRSVHHFGSSSGFGAPTRASAEPALASHWRSSKQTRFHSLHPAAAALTTLGPKRMRRRRYARRRCFKTTETLGT